MNYQKKLIFDDQDREIHVDYRFALDKGMYLPLSQWHAQSFLSMFTVVTHNMMAFFNPRKDWNLTTREVPKKDLYINSNRTLILKD